MRVSGSPRSLEQFSPVEHKFGEITREKHCEIHLEKRRRED